MKTIDLNADVGEGFNDKPLFEYLTSVNIACGAHAGNAQIMEEVAKYCLNREIAIGAHPSYDDKENFGRKVLNISSQELFASLCQQIKLLENILAKTNQKLSHIKPHGALYNQACSDTKSAQCIVDALIAVNPSLYLMCPKPSEMAHIAEKFGIKVIAEGFADRAYGSNGFIAPRSLPNSCITDPEIAAAQAVNLATGKKIQCIDSGAVLVNAQSICVHGDGNNALPILKKISKLLSDNGIIIRAYHLENRK